MDASHETGTNKKMNEICSYRDARGTVESPTPQVSIGLPVYNGENYLRESIDSLLAQDFEDFELLISDNASTDSTWDICQEYAARDKRVRLHRQDRNVGMFENFEYVFYHTAAPYFMWHGHDDRRSPNTLSVCKSFLDTHTDHVVCNTPHTVIDDSGAALYSLESPPWEEENLTSRFLDFLRSPNPWYAVYGLFRRECLSSALPAPRIDMGADIVTLSRVVICGKCAVLVEGNHCFQPPRVSSSKSAHLYYPTRLYGVPKRPRLFPGLQLRQTMLSAIAQSAGLSDSQRRALSQLVRTQNPLFPCLQTDIVRILMCYVTESERFYSTARAFKRRVKHLLASGLIS